MAISMQELERRGVETLRALLQQVPAVELNGIEIEPPGPSYRTDILAHITVSGRRHMLVCEVKSNGQPRYARMALLQLRNYLAHYPGEATPVLIAPYLSPEVQAFCREEKVSFLDLAGNCRLVFDGIFIERLVTTKPPTEHRELKSIFKPKSAQVLRVMLRDPSRSWRVAELAEAADVSLGHVSNVRTGLLDREWAKVDPGGFSLARPDAILDSWRDAYEPPAGDRIGFYTTLHGNAFEEAARNALNVANREGRAMLASFSAAQWLAPYARIGSHFFYADGTGVDALQRVLKLSSTAKGENVVITQMRDDGLFRDKIEPVPGITCTSLVQTYLDLSTSGERGREAAEHLRREKLKWLQ